MAWTSTTTRATGYLVTAAVWNAEIVSNMTHLEEVGYTEITGNVTISATTAATANTIVSMGALTYEAVPHLIEVFTPRAVTGSASNLICTLWDSATDLGRICQLSVASATTISSALYGCARITPTAASHTYIWKGWRDSANGTISAGPHGVVDGMQPAWIRISRVPT